MAQRTQFDKNQIDTVATKHTDMAQNISQQLEALHGEVQATLAGSGSDMTRALDQVYTSWKENVKRTVLDNLNVMAEAMKAEANNQEMQDSSNTSSIQRTAMDSFLGG